MPAINLTAEFDFFPNGTQLGQTFYLGGYTFNDPSGNNPLLIEEQSVEKGIKLSRDGVEIFLPVSVKTVDLRLGSIGSASANVSAMDSTGNTVRNLTFSINNQFITVRLVAPEIASVLVTGNNEDILTRVSIAVAVC